MSVCVDRAGHTSHRRHLQSDQGKVERHTRNPRSIFETWARVKPERSHQQARPSNWSRCTADPCRLAPRWFVGERVPAKP